jgi:hypothetical protein
MGKYIDIDDAVAPHTLASAELAELRAENERLRKKIAIGHTVERSIYKDAERWRKLERLAETMETCQMAILFVENMSDQINEG